MSPSAGKIPARAEPQPLSTTVPRSCRQREISDWSQHLRRSVRPEAESEQGLRWRTGRRKKVSCDVKNRGTPGKGVSELPDSSASAGQKQVIRRFASPGSHGGRDLPPASGEPGQRHRWLRIGAREQVRQGTRENKPLPVVSRSPTPPARIRRIVDRVCDTDKRTIPTGAGRLLQHQSRGQHPGGMRFHQIDRLAGRAAGYQCGERRLEEFPVQRQDPIGPGLDSGRQGAKEVPVEFGAEPDCLGIPVRHGSLESSGGIADLSSRRQRLQFEGLTREYPPERLRFVQVEANESCFLPKGSLNAARQAQGPLRRLPRLGGTRPRLCFHRCQLVQEGARHLLCLGGPLGEATPFSGPQLRQRFPILRRKPIPPLRGAMDQGAQPACLGLC